MKTTVGVIAPLTMALALVGTAASGEPPPEKKMISLTEVAPGLTPVSDYTGDFWGRSTLLGDLGGMRQDLYDRGITFDVALTQVVQGIVSGGVGDDDWGYNALLDYGIMVDTAKLGLWSGGLLAATAQTSWGDLDFPKNAGNLSPVNYTTLFPVPFETSTELMEYYLIQALPRETTLILGRINATNFLDRNRFANDPRNQFLNTSLGNDLLWGYFLTYSVYAAILETSLPKGFSAALAVWTPETAPGDYKGVWNTWGVVGQLTSTWKLFGDLPGELTVVGGGVTKDADALDNPRLVPGLVTGDVPTKSGNWLVVFNGEQYLWTPQTTGKQVRTRSFDFQKPGVGLFWRFGYTPEDRNAWNATVSGGVGARGVIPGRPYDRMGLGVYALFASGDLKDQALIGDRVTDEVGVEAFYNVALTPWLQLSGDVQWIASGIESSDDAVVLSTRLFMQF